jgi:beta-mannanase
MTFDHEMNANWYPWGYHGSEGITPAEWIAAWDHVTTVINAIAGRYVTWVWAPNIDLGATSFSQYWPGENVTWVGLDGYYQNRVSTWANTFAASVRQIESVSGNLPFIVAETGIPITDSNSAAQVDNLIAGAESAHADAVIYFDSIHWILTSNAAAELVRALASASAHGRPRGSRNRVRP